MLYFYGIETSAGSLHVVRGGMQIEVMSESRWHINQGT